MDKIQQSISLSDTAYSMIKSEIINGRLKAGESLPEEKLATELGISRTPLREALKILAHEGLLELEKGKPATVATFEKRDALEFMEIRRVLEVYSIQKLVPDEKLISELEDNLRLQKEAVIKKEYTLFIDLDRTFHLLLTDRNTNQKLVNMIHNVNTGVNRAFLVLSNTLSISTESAYEEHYLILESIKKGDLELTKQSMEEHLKSVQKRFLTYFEEGETK